MNMYCFGLFLCLGFWFFFPKAGREPKSGLFAFGVHFFVFYYFFFLSYMGWVCFFSNNLPVSKFNDSSLMYCCRCRTYALDVKSAWSSLFWFLIVRVCLQVEGYCCCLFCELPFVGLFYWFLFYFILFSVWSVFFLLYVRTHWYVILMEVFLSIFCFYYIYSVNRS